MAKGGRSIIVTMALPLWVSAARDPGHQRGRGIPHVAFVELASSRRLKLTMPSANEAAPQQRA